MKSTDTSYKRTWLRPGLILVLLAAVLMTACRQETQSRTSGPLKIVCTTGMIADAVQNIVGDKAVVNGLMGPGVDPHLYKTTQADLKLLREADMIFYNGLHLEGKMSDILEKLAREKTVYPVSNSIPSESLLKPAGENATDPHIWFDVNLWKSAVSGIGKTLMETDSLNADLYKSNQEAFQQKLDLLNQEVLQAITAIPEEQRVLITAHDAFNYFSKAYKIEVRGLQGMSTVSEFGLKDVNELVDYIVDRKIKAVFVESSVPRKSLEAVVAGCQEKGHGVKIGGSLYSDAMGEADTPAGTYIGMVRSNVRTIVEGLMR